MNDSNENPRVITAARKANGGMDEAAARLMRLATYASVSVALTLIVTKLGAWAVTESISLLSTLIDSLLDALASMVNLVAVRHALQPADREHRFGHGKAEALAGLAQSAFIAGSAAFLVLQAADRVIRPRDISHPDIGYAVMVFSIVLTFALVLFQRYVVRRSGSVAISADSLHYQTDLLINASVILSLFLASEMGLPLADPLFAIGIAAYIVWGAVQIARQSLDMLMDKELPDDDRKRIQQIVNGHPAVVGMHDLRTRASGAQVFIQLHLELDPEMPLRDAHVISEQVMKSLCEAYPQAEVIIHEDPEDAIEDRAVFQ